MTIHGSGLQRRSYLHVDDVTQAYDAVLHKGAIGEARLTLLY
jgi:dTDP-D-glucose 4,6-dehydratase